MGGLAEASTTPAPSLPSLPAADPGVPGHSGDVHHPRAPGSDAATAAVPPAAKGTRHPRSASGSREDTSGNASGGGEDGKCHFSNAARGTQLNHTTYVVASVEMDLLRAKSRSRGISQEAIAVNQVHLIYAQDLLNKNPEIHQFFTYGSDRITYGSD